MIISIPSRLKNTFFLKFKTAVTNIRDMLLGFIFYLWFYILQQFLTNTICDSVMHFYNGWPIFHSNV